MTAGKMYPFIRACAGILLLASAYPSNAQSVIPVRDLLLDAADANTGWRTSSTNTLTVDSQIKVHGTASLKTVGSGGQRFFKTFSRPLDVTRYRYLTFWFYIDRPDRLVATGDAGQIELTSSGTLDSREWNWSVRALHLQRGWNYVVLDMPGKDRDAAAPINPAAANFLRFYVGITGSITTRIDHITFTNREPLSSAYEAYLDLKRISRSTAAVEQNDAVWGFLSVTQSGSVDRQKACRTMRIDLTHREITGNSLQDLGVTAVAVDNELREKRFLKEYMCGERVMSRNEVLTRLQARARTEIAVIAEIAALFDLTLEAASETQDRVLQLDLVRIHNACGTDYVELGDYLNTGALPPGSFPGTNLLVKQCAGGLNDILVRLGTFESPIVDRRTAYGRCMSAFTSQASECDNPYASPDSDYRQRINNLTILESHKDAYKERMARSLRTIAEYGDLRLIGGGPTEPRPDAPAAQRPELERQHANYDTARGEYTLLDEAEANAEYAGNHPPDEIRNDPPQEGFPRDIETTRQMNWRLAHTYDAARYRAGKHEALERMLESLRQICSRDPQDPQCQTSDGELLPPKQQPTNQQQQQQRCASMDLGDGQHVWFNRAPGPDGVGGQINEADRIEHCLCKVFDRGYGATLPGDLVQIQSGCPTPEERVAQECLSNPTDGIDGMKPACRHLMQPISMDRDALGAKICERILPNCDAPYLKLDGDCGCGTLNADGSTSMPGCAAGIPNCLDGIPAANGCGCQPFFSGANVCTKGGKDFYLTTDLTNNLLVRVFPNKTYSTDHILVAKAGGVRFATPAVTRSQLFNSSQLPIRVVLPGSGYDGTGQINVSCTNLSIGTRNFPIETIPLANLSTTGINNSTINLNGSERTACYGSNANSEVHFEFHVDSKVNQTVGFLDILGDIGTIKPPCLEFPPRPTPGPRPLDSWPLQWTFSNNQRFTTIFNGTGLIPPLLPTLPEIPVCVIEGIPMPCP